MKKYINLLLIGFLIFIIGLIISGVELSKYEFVNGLPDEFKTNSYTFSLEIDENKTYKIKRNAYNQNIKIKKKINNTLRNELIITNNYQETSIPISSTTTVDDEVKIIFANQLTLKLNDLKKLYNLTIGSIINKKIYDYNLLKYSDITIYGNEDVLEKVEIVDYE